MEYKIISACVCHIGKLRANNEDNFLFLDRFLKSDDDIPDGVLTGEQSSSENPVFAVFDGVGGESKGELASLIAASGLAECRARSPKNENLLRQAVYLINDEIIERTAKENLDMMATTMAALRFSDVGISLCNAGDSRIYRLSNKKLVRISLDQTAPLIAQEVKPRLNQYLGKEKGFVPYITKLPAAAGDIFLICSDGITDMIPEDKIARILMRTPEKAASKLLECALKAGGRDNITAIVCQISKT